jgi:heptosyltransferase II
MASLEKAAKTVLFSVLRLFIHVRRYGTIPRSSVHRILIIRQHNQLGDMLCAVPLFRALRSTYPDAHIALLARPLNSEVLRGSPYLDEIIVYDKKQFIRAPFGVFRFARDLRKKHFDLALVPSTVSMSVTSDAICFFSGAKRRIGPGSLLGRKNLTGYLYNVRVDLDWRRTALVHQTQRNLDLASILVLNPVPLELHIGLQPDELRAGKDQIESARGHRRLIVGFHPGAAKPANRWDALRFAEIANRCAEIYHAFIVISSGPDDAEQVQEMVLNMPNDHMVVTSPVRAAASVIHHCDVFLTNDTGMMHVAAGVGTPTLSLFGPTDPLQWAPSGSRHRFILGRGRTMQSISVEKVWSVMIDMLEEALARKREQEVVAEDTSPARGAP